MESQLLVVSIESPEDLSDRERQTRAETLNLARQLGAEVVLASGSNVGRALLGVARERGISLLVLGKPQNSSAIPFRRRESPVRWLERNADGIPLLLVPAEAQVSEHQDGTFASSLEPKETRRREYLGAALMAIPATVLGLLFEQVLGYWSVALIYLLTVTLTGVSFGRGPTVMLATLCAALWDLVFIPPRFTLYIGHPQDLLMFFMFFAVALAVGHLTTRLRQRERLERRMELRATALYQLTRKLAAATSLEEVISAGCSQTERVFQASVVIALRNADGGLSATLGVSNAWIPLPGEFEVMLESFEEKRAIEGAGASAKGDRLLCLPLLVAGGVEGVLGLRLPGGYFLDANHRELLDAFAAQMGIVSEIQRIAKERRSSELLADSARLQKTLFDSVSHELKTPIAAIRVALEQPAVSAEEIRRATDRLHRAVEQLLSATRIESGLLKPNREWCDPADLANEAIVLAQGGAEIRLTAAEPLPLMRVDAGLVVQSLVSLLENALTHGASDQGPEVFVSSDAASVRFEVADRGRGIPPGAENRVFEKFHRLPGASAGGIGLGLAIAKQFSELLGGELRACNREGGGVSFFLTLPVGGRVEFPA
jgi:two-component system sensor histidine kinase KdpD